MMRTQRRCSVALLGFPEELSCDSDSSTSDSDSLVNELEELSMVVKDKDKVSKGSRQAARTSFMGEKITVTTDLRQLYKEAELISASVNEPFDTQMTPSDMRCLALVAHNHMKPAMKHFIESHDEILKNFRLTGTNTTMTMCRTVFGPDNPDVHYGPTCTSGPLGGDAQLATLMCLEDVGAVIFFMDPLSAHPHQADIDSLVRLTNVNNIILCPNPTTAMSFMWVLRQALTQNSKAKIPSFFQTLESPSVTEYKNEQKKALANAVAS